ncbi:MAG: glycerophosphodiester phosphodiesterase [Spirochaetaceae bacterium]|nr:glycerophosphodiester phosphodiesterase [Spirochaetaceae bacterium]
MLTYGHRGFSGCYPENTMISFKAAINEAHCDGIELDVHLTKDDQLVIIHDELVDRTTDGKGLVMNKTLKELKELDASYNFPQFKGIAKIPTFEEYCQYMSKKLTVVTNVEIKSNLIYYKDIEEKVIKMIKKYGLENNVIISSFNHQSIVFTKAIDENIPCGLLQDSKGLINAGYMAHKMRVEFYHPDISTLTKEAVDECIMNGIILNVWTVNDMESLKKCVDWGITGIITNYPDIVKEYLVARGLN